MQLPGQMFAPTFLLVEVASAIERATKDEARARRAAESLRRLAALTLVPVDDGLIKDATYVASHYSLRAGDALYVAAAHPTVDLASGHVRQAAVR
jgi:predicted nucleic acid-binding protein